MSSIAGRLNSTSRRRIGVVGVAAALTVPAAVLAVPIAGATTTVGAYSNIETSWASVSGAGGGSTACGIRTDGTLWCWGYAETGKRFQAWYPEQVGSASTWQSVSVAVNGQPSYCGVRDNGTLWCWGVNRDGQLGLGDHRLQFAGKAAGLAREAAERRAIAHGLRSVGNAGHGVNVSFSKVAYCWPYRPRAGPRPGVW